MNQNYTDQQILLCIANFRLDNDDKFGPPTLEHLARYMKGNLLLSVQPSKSNLSMRVRSLINKGYLMAWEGVGNRTFYPCTLRLTTDGQRLAHEWGET